MIPTILPGAEYACTTYWTWSIYATYATWIQHAQIHHGIGCVRYAWAHHITMPKLKMSAGKEHSVPEIQKFVFTIMISDSCSLDNGGLLIDDTNWWIISVSNAHEHANNIRDMVLSPWQEEYYRAAHQEMSTSTVDAVDIDRLCQWAKVWMHDATLQEAQMGAEL